MKVALMDLRNKDIIDLPDLKYPVRHVGMTYDVDAKMLTVAGGQKYSDGESSLSNVVFQLPDYGDYEWKELPELNYEVANPMVVNDKKYLYVLGGEGCARCVRISKKNPEKWEKLPNLPTGVELPQGATLEEEYNGNLYSGAVLFDGKVRVLTRSQYITLEDDPEGIAKKSWQVESYVDNTIRHLTPAIYQGRIIAGIQRDKPLEVHQTDEVSVEFFMDPEKYPIVYWIPLEATPTDCAIGAGRFVVFEAEDTW